MLFYCFADLHGYVPEVSGFLEKPDAVLFLGDLDWAVKRILDAFSGVPALAVPGNHDPWANPFYGAAVNNLHGKTIEFKGLRIGGLGGCLRYKPGSDFLFWDAEYQEILSKMPRVDIFISHCPPAGLPWCDLPKKNAPFHEAHEGSAALAEYIQRTTPVVLLCGHLHVSGTAKMGRTLVRQVYGMEKLELPERF